MFKCMGNSKTPSKLLIMAFLSIVGLAGCHGSIGWDRLQSPIGSGNTHNVDLPQQKEVNCDRA